MSTSTVAPPATETTAPPRKRSRLKTVFLSLLGCFVLFVGVVLVLASTKPDVFRVERSITVNAPAEKIRPHIDDLKKWTAWSPFEKVDPDMQRDYSGAENGVGARYAWEGDSNIGAGRIEITESTPEKIAMSLEFLKPMAAKNVAEFTMVPEGDGTKVTWSMHGPNTFMGKMIQVFLDMDDMCGTPFNEGLTNLKGLAEQN
ncbi:MAG TPA: SRPBCC family protein [Caulifigura sp.]|jgi:hypothetical protein|nr:SRPBCC family protein [Caulifigura sp.]